jgi:hypothetical protein
MGGDGSVFSLAQDASEETSAKMTAWWLATRKRAPSDADSNEDINSDNAGVVMLDDLGVGATKSEQGTLNCENWARFFRRKGATFRRLTTPAILDDPNICVDVHGDLASYKGRAYAVRTSMGDDLTTIVIAAQPQNGGGWGKAAGLTLVYDRVLTAPSFYCELDDCGALAEQAGQAIRRYDGGHGAGELIDALTRDEARRWADMDPQDDPEANTSGVWEWPYSSGDAAEKAIGFSDWTHFGSDARYFPLRWHGELLLARIGHDHIKDFTTGDWLLAAWRWNPDKEEYTTALGMLVAVERGDFLLAVPSKPR